MSLVFTQFGQGLVLHLLYGLPQLPVADATPVHFLQYPLRTAGKVFRCDLIRPAACILVIEYGFRLLEDRIDLRLEPSLVLLDTPFPYESVPVRRRLYLRPVYVLHFQRHEPLCIQKQDHLPEQPVKPPVRQTPAPEPVDCPEVRPRHP